MSRVAILIVAAACGGAAPNANPSNTTSTAVEIRPIFVVHDVDPTVAQVLACARLERGRPTTFLDGPTCAPLIDPRAELEAITETGRVPVTLGATSTTTDCDAGENPREVPTLAIVGLPEEASVRYIVAKGMRERANDVPASVLKTIHEVRPRFELKREGHFGPNVDAQLDVDGDGTFEIILSSDPAQDHELFTSDGKPIARAGCYIG